MSNQAGYGIGITATDHTAKGVKSAEKNLGGITKRQAVAAEKGAARFERSYTQAGRGLIRTFTQVEGAVGRAFGGSAGGGSIIGRLGALRQVGSLAAGGLGEAAAAGVALEGSMAGLAGAALGPVAVLGALAVASFKLADGWGKSANSLGNMASLIGVSTKGMQEFANAAERVGVDKGTATGALGGLAQTLDDARYGRNSGAVSALARVGVQMKLKEDGTADTEAMLPAVADAMKRQNSSGRRTLARALGIPEAAIAAFAQGGKPLTADMADSSKNGAIMSDADVKLGREITHRDTVASQFGEKQLLAVQRGNAGIVKSVGDAAIDAYDGLTKPSSGQGPSAPARREAQQSGAQSSFGNGRLQLSRKDVVDLKKTVQTEWDKASPAQGKGIIDTILNRRASGHWGKSVASVVNARSQFSDVNGPVAWKRGRHSVDEIPMSQVSRKTNRLVDAYLAARSNGQGSIVADNLNYANPNYSDRKNLRWINRLDGPILGSGKSTHRHGTTPELERYRPGAFQVSTNEIPVKVAIEFKNEPPGTKATVTAGRSRKPSVSHAFSAD